MVGNQLVDQFHVPEAVGIRFHHGHHLGVRVQEGAVEIEVVCERGETHVEDGEMSHVLELGHDVFKMETACPFYQYGFVREFRNIGEKILRGSEKLLCLACEACLMCRQVCANADETADLVSLQPLV